MFFSLSRNRQTVNHDYQPPLESHSPRKRSRTKWGRWLLLGLILLTGLPFLLRQVTTSTQAHSNAEPALQEPAAPEIKRETLLGKIAQGDTVTALLGSYFSPQALHQLGKESKDIFPLSRICAGQPYKICLADGAFERFEYDIDSNEQLFISQNDEGFTIERKDIVYEVTTHTVTGVIESSLFEAVTATGESDVLAMNLADIFGWDIDFILDIRQGDSFQVLVEKRFREGKSAGYGRILVAEFINQGNRFDAILFQDGDRRPDYYSSDGQSVRKAFLKAPLSFSRISSGYTMRRLHPITKTWKAHPAIDYAAPIGTPVKTVGDGTVTQKGYKRGNGYYLKIRHFGGYETMYLHLSRFAKGIQKGSSVRQGQLIAYVGSSGMSTGPHLDFRMRKNGAPVNPQKIKAPSIAPVTPEHLVHFQSEAAKLLARLNSAPVQIAAKTKAGSTQKN